MFFMAGFAKNVQENIDRATLTALKDYAVILFRMTDKDIEKSLELKRLREVKCDEENAVAGNP